MKRILHALVAIAAVLCVPLLIADEATGLVIEKRKLEGVLNYSYMKFSDGFVGGPVGFGGATAPSAMTGLRSEGFASVINLRMGNEDGVDIATSREAAEVAGIKYLHMPMDPESLTLDRINAILTTIADASNQPVFIHCNSATRVAVVWMIGRVTRDNWSVDNARTEIPRITESPDKAISMAMLYLNKR